MAHATITICSGCSRQFIAGRYQEPIVLPSSYRVTHGMCEDCVRELHPEDAEWIIKRAAARIARNEATAIGV